MALMASIPQFRTDMDRFKNKSLIDPVVEEWIGKRTADEAIDLLQKERVPCGVVNTIDQLLIDPQVQDREMIQFMDYPDLGEIPVPGIPIKLSSSPGSIDRPAPKLGEHNEEVYCGLLGLKSREFERLRQEKII